MSVATKFRKWELEITDDVAAHNQNSHSL